MEFVLFNFEESESEFQLKVLQYFRNRVANVEQIFKNKKGVFKIQYRPVSFYSECFHLVFLLVFVCICLLYAKNKDSKKCPVSLKNKSV